MGAQEEEVVAKILAAQVTEAMVELAAEEMELMAVIQHLLPLEQGVVVKKIMEELVAEEATALLILLLVRVKVAQGQVGAMEELAAAEEVMVLLILLRMV
jgi:hypothetical protein